MRLKDGRARPPRPRARRSRGLRPRLSSWTARAASGSRTETRASCAWTIPGRRRSRRVRSTSRAGRSRAACSVSRATRPAPCGSGRPAASCGSIPQTGRQAHFTTADGLANNLVTSAARDAAGALWFGTPEGVSRFVPGPDAASAPAARRDRGVPRERQPAARARARHGRAHRDHARARTRTASAWTSRRRASRPAAASSSRRGSRASTRSGAPPTPDATVRYVGLAAGRVPPRRARARSRRRAGPEATAAFRMRPPFWRRPEFLVVGRSPSRRSPPSSSTGRASGTRSRSSA